MKEVIYKSYEELPLFISVEVLANLLGISSSSCYELMHEEDFPTIHIGKRMMVPKEDFKNAFNECPVSIEWRE